MPEHVKRKLEEEIRTLEHELNHELPQELKKAIAHGDLTENAEYHMAKQRQEIVRARLGQLKKRMGDLSLINMSSIPRDKAALGSTVVGSSRSRAGAASAPAARRCRRCAARPAPSPRCRGTGP